MPKKLENLTGALYSTIAISPKKIASTNRTAADDLEFFLSLSELLSSFVYLSRNLAIDKRFKNFILYSLLYCMRDIMPFGDEKNYADDTYTV